MYTPHRDERFDYLWDVMSFIEERQCNSCAFKSDVEDYPMCLEVQAELIEEKPVDVIDDHGDDGVVCTKYRNVMLEEQARADQFPLF